MKKEGKNVRVEGRTQAKNVKREEKNVRVEGRT